MQYLPLVFLFSAVLVAGYIYLHPTVARDAAFRETVRIGILRPLRRLSAHRHDRVT